MSLLLRRRALLQSLSDNIEGIGADGQIVLSYTGSVDNNQYRQMRYASVDYGNNYQVVAVTASVPALNSGSTGGKFYQAQLKYGVGWSIIPNLVRDEYVGSQVFMVTGPTGSVATVAQDISIFGYNTALNLLTIYKRIRPRNGTSDLIPSSTTSKQKIAVATAPELSKVIVALDTASIAIDFRNTNPWGSTPVEDWIVNNLGTTGTYTASTQCSVAKYPTALSYSLEGSKYFNLDLKTSKDPNLTYCIVGSWASNGTASYSRDGATTWQSLNAALTGTSESLSPHTDWYESSEISLDGKDTVIATDGGLYFSHDYLQTFEYKSYEDVGITNFEYPNLNTDNVIRHIKLAASSKLKHIYIFGETYLGTENTDGVSGSIWASHDYGKSFTQVLGPFYAHYRVSQDIDCSANGQYVVFKTPKVSNTNMSKVSQDFGDTWTTPTGLGLDYYTWGRENISSIKFYREYPGYPSHSISVSASL